MTAECLFVERHLNAFVDGELRGTPMLRVLEHLDTCAECGARVQELRDLGDLLRAAAPSRPEPQMLAGLSSTVISRITAEEAQSWKGMWLRATDDWHWFLVGAGSVAATFVSTVLLSALLAFGPKPERDDSLSGFYAAVSLPPPPAYNFLMIAPVGAQQDWMLAQLDDGAPVASRDIVQLASLTSDRLPSEAELVDALAAVITRNGRIVPLDELTPKDRKRADDLLSAIIRARLNSGRAGLESLNIQQIRMVTSTSVKAKGL